MPTLGFKLFFIGFNKCGTRSLHRYFAECGLSSFHGGGHHNVQVAILRNIVFDAPCLQGHDSYDVYADVDAIRSQFRHVDKDYPGSKFVLNVRDVDRWILSRLNHMNGRYVDFLNLVWGVDRDWREWVDRWRTEFAQHEQATATYFKGRASDFLRFDIEKDVLPVLLDFVGVKTTREATSLPHLGATEAECFAFENGRIVKTGE